MDNHHENCSAGNNAVGDSDLFTVWTSNEQFSGFSPHALPMLDMLGSTIANDVGSFLMVSPSKRTATTH